MEIILSKKQKEFYNVLRAYIQEHNYAPSVRELCELTGLHSTGTVHGYIERLIEKGVLAKEEDKPRTLRIVRSLDN